MRELNECTAEVFRRSEQRIEERRRKRNRVLAVCIPVCLIAAVSSAIIFPSMTPEMGDGYLSQSAGEMVGNAEMSPVCPYTAAEIQGTGLFPAEHAGKVTDRPAVAELFDTIDSLFAQASGNDREGSENLPASEDSSAENHPADAIDENQAQTESANTWTGCTITFTAEDGSRAVYRLSGNTLVNVNTNETVFLSDSQTAGLLAALGLAE